jgi:hypothetical protein
MNTRLASLLLLLPGILSAQAAAEAALGAGSAATMAAPAKGMGKSVAKTVEGLNQLLQKDGQPGAAARGSVTSGSSIKPAETKAAEVKPEVVYEDPAGIRKGMEYSELIRRFGPPALKMTTGEGEILAYARKNVTRNITLQSGKVAQIN